MYMCMYTFTYVVPKQVSIHQSVRIKGGEAGHTVSFYFILLLGTEQRQLVKYELGQR
jgi:hypothetical protein